MSRRRLLKPTLRSASEQARHFERPLSMRILARKHRLEAPVSLWALLDALAPDQVVFRVENARAGDVSVWASWALLATGWWHLEGRVLDTGSLFGDKYVFALRVNHADPDGKVGVVKQDGTLSHDSAMDFEQTGNDRWIAENWDQIKGGGFRWTLHTEGTENDLIEVALEGLLLGALTVLYLRAESDGKCHTAENGSRICEYP